MAEKSLGRDDSVGGEGSTVEDPFARQVVDPDYHQWRQFADAATPKDFCQSWLPLQCGMLEGIHRAMVLWGKPDQGPFTPIAVWPDSNHSVIHLSEAAEQSLKERRGLLISSHEVDGDKRYHVAYPIDISGKIHGVIVLEVEPCERRKVQAMLRHLHWGAAWLEVMIRRTESAHLSKTTARLKKVLDFVAAAVEQGGYYPSAMAFVTQIATLLQCDRVSLGHLHKKHIRVKVLSHSTEFGKKTNLVQAIGKAMDEAMDQNAVVTFPERRSHQAAPIITVAHNDLVQKSGSGCVLTIPFKNIEGLRGAITLERKQAYPFDPDTVEICEAAVALAGPILETKRSEDRWPIAKVIEFFTDQLKRILGPGYLGKKIVLLILLAATFYLSFATVDYRISARTVLEGVIQRVVSAPFDAYVKQVNVRPGDIVGSGTPLCLLDDRDLILERHKWLTEKDQLGKKFQEAIALHQRAESRILGAKIKQAEAQISLLNKQLIRTVVTAPFDGVVMSGDLSQSLGAPVERGKILFIVAPLDEYRVIVEVDERNIADVAVNQRGELILPSLPGEIFPFFIKKVTPVSAPREGRNLFRVEGRLDKPSKRLRPGMEGIGKIFIERRKLVWVWTHEMVDWIRLQLWRWWP